MQHFENFASIAAGNRTVHLRVIETTDLHLHLLPYDYYNDCPAEGLGLQRAAELIAEARAEVVTFSQVYVQPEKAVIALPGSPVENASSFEDLRAARWGAAIGTTDLTYLENVLGVEGAAVYDDQIGVFQAMQAGQIDGTLVALPTALFATAVQIPEANIVALLPADENDRGHGLLFEFGNPLVEWVDDALSAVIARGVVEDLKNEYLVADPDLPMITE